MNQRDVITFYSDTLNASYVTTNEGYMNKTHEQLVLSFKERAISHGGNSNFDDRHGLISVVDIGLASDFKVDKRKNQGQAKSQELTKAKKTVQEEYRKKGYKTANGKRR